MKVYLNDVVPSSYDPEIHITRCPRCGNVVTVDVEELNICLNCHEEIEVVSEKPFLKGTPP
jgi:hypothetical protein